MRNRKIAWILLIPIIIASIFIGSFSTNLQMRSRAEAVYRDRAELVLRQKVQLAYSMLTLYRLNDSSDAAKANEILQNLNEALKHIDAFEQVDYQKLLAIADDLLLYADNFDEADARRMRNLNLDIHEQALILSQTEYNKIAEEFNSTILGVFGSLPVYR